MRWEGRERGRGRGRKKKEKEKGGERTEGAGWEGALMQKEE